MAEGKPMPLATGKYVLFVSILVAHSLFGGYWAGTRPNGAGWRFFSWHPLLMMVGEFCSVLMRVGWFVLCWCRHGWSAFFSIIVLRTFVIADPPPAAFNVVYTEYKTYSQQIIHHTYYCRCLGCLSVPSRLRASL